MALNLLGQLQLLETPLLVATLVAPQAMRKSLLALLAQLNLVATQLRPLKLLTLTSRL
jgi:hypothetical protein